MNDVPAPLREPLRITPAYKERVWGGQQLRGGVQPIGEAWLIHEDQPIAEGDFAGQTLAELAQRLPEALLGAGRPAQRFPLLLKLLDCQDWLSVQVHPDDALAREMVGPEEFGKTEAWHLLKAEPGAKLISGTREGVALDEVQAAILNGSVQSVTQEREVRVGDTLLVPAGTLHALGPGVLIYEIQQTSDTTYRVYDWDRPASAGRELHLAESAKVVRVGEAPLTPHAQGEGTHRLAACDYFILEELVSAGTPLSGDTGNKACHLLTVKEGEAQLQVNDDVWALQPLDTLLLPAALGAYQLTGNFRVLRSRLP